MKSLCFVKLHLSWLAGLSGAMLSLCALAADPPPTTPQTLAELTALALQQHPDTRAAWAAVQQSQAGERIARAGWWPTLSGSYSAQRSRSIASEGNEIGPQTRRGPSLSLSWLLFDFGTRSGGIDQAAAQTLADQYSFDQRLQDVALGVESAYYAVIGTRALAAANQLALDETQTNLDAARVRHRAGLATIADVYQAEAALAAARLALHQARGAQRIAEGGLAVAVGYAPDTELPLVEWQPDSDTPVLQLPSLAELLANARRLRPDLLAALAEEQAVAAAVRAARGSALPSLRLAASAGQTQVSDRGRTDQYSAGLTLSVPLFTGGALQGAIAQARAAQAGAAASSQSLLRSVEQQVWTAYQNLLTAQGSVDASAAQLRSAERAAEAIRARYRNGLSSILEVLSTETTLAQARVARIQAGLDWSLARASLAHDTGAMPVATPPQTAGDSP